MVKPFENPLERKSAGTTASIPAAKDPVEALSPSQIRRDGGTQMRGGLHNATRDDYVEALRAGKQFDAIDVYFDGTDYWLWDGFHRIAAHVIVFGVETNIAAKVMAGTRRDAVLAAAGANSRHGLRRSDETKRRSVETLLLDEEWGQWTDREIARRCNVSHPFVAKQRAQLIESGRLAEEGQRTYVDRHGNTTSMNTGAIAEANRGRAAGPSDRSWGRDSGGSSGEMGIGDSERLPLTLVETVAVVWRAVDRGGRPAGDADAWRLHWLEGITAADVEATLSAVGADPAWSGRGLDDGVVALAVEQVRKALADRVEQEQGEAELDGAVFSLAAESGAEAAIADEQVGTEADASALPADLRALGWVIQAVQGTHLVYGYRARDGERMARSTSTRAEPADVIGLIRAVEGSDEPVQMAMDDVDVNVDVDVDVDVEQLVTLTLSLAAVRAVERMLYGLAAGSVEKGVLVELRRVVGKGARDT